MASTPALGQLSDELIAGVLQQLDPNSVRNALLASQLFWPGPRAFNTPAAAWLAPPPVEGAPVEPWSSAQLEIIDKLDPEALVELVMRTMGAGGQQQGAERARLLRDTALVR